MGNCRNAVIIKAYSLKCADRLKPVRDSLKILNTFFNAVIADAEYFCNLRGKSDILMIVLAQKSAVKLCQAF